MIKAGETFYQIAPAAPTEVPPAEAVPAPERGAKPVQPRNGPVPVPDPAAVNATAP